MRILLADDHTLLCDAIKSYLEQSDLAAEVIAAPSLADAIEKACDQPQPDLVLLDLDMPGMNGPTGILTFRQAVPRTPVAIVSALATPENVLSSLQNGAAGFIPKTMGAEAMLVALRLILTGEQFVPAALFQDVQALSLKRAANRIRLLGT